MYPMFESSNPDDSDHDVDVWQIRSADNSRVVELKASWGLVRDLRQHGSHITGLEKILPRYSLLICVFYLLVLVPSRLFQAIRSSSYVLTLHDTPICSLISLQTPRRIIPLDNYTPLNTPPEKVSHISLCSRLWVSHARYTPESELLTLRILRSNSTQQT